MRRFGQILWTMFSGISLLLCAAAAGLWVRSYFVADVVQCLQDPESRPPWDYDAPPAPVGWSIYSPPGHVVLLRTTMLNISALDVWCIGWERLVLLPSDVSCSPQRIDRPKWDWKVAGLAYVRGEGDDVGSWMLVVHWSCVVVPFAVAPLAWRISLDRRRHKARIARVGLCPRCAYDLRASPARCPECGTVPAR